MKLVELLARELKEWPSNAYVAVQDGDSEHTIWFLESDHRGLSFISGEWKCSSPFDILISRPSILASDHATAIVTRSDWKAECARIAKPANKAAKDSWIRHRGGKCPVDAGAMVDARWRDGSIHEGVYAVGGLSAGRWIRDEYTATSNDIMAYRLHKPAEQVEACSKPELQINLPDGYGEIYNAQAVDSGPLQWRDRVTEIDATTQALTTERAELVQRLASEGFALIGRINELLTDAAQKHEDMSDWQNWKVGDFIEIVSVEKAEVCASYYDDGALVKIESVEREKYKGTMPVEIIDSDGDYIWPELAGIKWHSRPSA